MLRRVQEQKAVGLFYGQRALCIGALNTRAYVGTSNHTHQKQTPFKRLAHTGVMFERVMFGSREEADAALRAVAGMHRRVNGELAQDEGPFPAGTSYDAYAPELMWWTVAVMLDSAVWFYEHLVRRMSDAEREQLYADYVRFAELFGMPRDAAPADYRAFRAWFDAELRSHRMHLTDEARYVGYASAFEIPMPAHRQPFKRVHDLLMLNSLPGVVRRHYRLELSLQQRLAARAVMEALRRSNPLVPGQIKRGSCIPEFEMVARTEARRIARGEPTPQVGDQLAA
ncbi:MAG TPA: oxygenase MpaB family protein [Solirubrobacteraceae bacterium]